MAAVYVEDFNLVHRFLDELEFGNAVTIVQEQIKLKVIFSNTTVGHIAA